MIQHDADNFLWVEKYRPTKISDCILPKRIGEFAQAMIDKGEIQNLMLVGGAGTGKTTLARALCNQLDMDYIIINCSENGNIDTLRTTIRDFASTVSLMGGVKAVILDEADGLTSATQQALRNFIEEFSANCRFIFTANFESKIIDPLKSRTVYLNMSLTKQEKLPCIKAFDDRVKQILDFEGIKYDSKVLTQLLIKHFPDFRKTLNELQKLTIRGELSPEAMAMVTVNMVGEIYEMLKGKKFSEMRKWVAENPDCDFPMISRLLWNAVDNHVDADSIPQFLLHYNQYQINHGIVVDREVNLVAFLLELMVDVKFK